jgi:hypothetical protein
MHTLRGGCHCGNVEILFETPEAPEDMEPRACGCSFCRRHGAISVSHPGGRARIRVRDERGLIRYRFGLETADFLVCGTCGVSLGAVTRVDGRGYATLNANALDDAERFLRDARPHGHEGESAEQRAARRRAAWTPAEIELA